MKKVLATVLVFAMILSLAGCGLFSNDAVVKLGDYTHNEPKDVKYDQRIVLKGSGFEKTVESMASAAAYPSASSARALSASLRTAFPPRTRVSSGGTMPKFAFIGTNAPVPPVLT